MNDRALSLECLDVVMRIRAEGGDITSEEREKLTDLSGLLEEEYLRSFRRRRLRNELRAGRPYTSPHVVGFLNKTRADLFDHLLGVAAEQGVDVRDEAFLRSLGLVINSATGAD